ncbi:Antitoxin (plasmid) [Rhodovastum atsumiense]|uniref:Antitoxin n=1 Tax=Rhodovastum atsumiense TaxID=504468 RepID=A0A5M6III2_9PROT|nr:type II toxin-antitoxin system Phd/YefM family antitoxin [Rhodovastum atsumiense]KAA5608071.1 type II toxin-antitoxin system Phd/YefM family antitoxin [Rhodovastum atsumiense]CAH2606528.1 Antitoxin [Rhodovastum atsumiense]
MPPRSMTTAVARDRLAEAVNRVAFGKERITITRRGKALAAVVPIEDLAALEALEDARDAAEIRARLEEWRESGEAAVSLEEVARRHGVALSGK